MSDQDTSSSVADRAYKFATNGGGTITYRLVMLAAMAIVWWTVQWALGELTATLHSIDERLATIERSAASYDVRITDDTNNIALLRDGQRKVWDRLNEHDHRITVLEARQPPPN